jgi:hypothetical protein
VLRLRRNTPTRADQISTELGECRHHLREAASLIASGAAERLAPRVDHAKGLMAPTMEKARGAAVHGLETMTTALGGTPAARNTRPSSSRWPLLAAALGVGLAAGAAAALVMERRGARWNEYEPVTVLDGAELESDRDEESTEPGTHEPFLTGLDGGESVEEVVDAPEQPEPGPDASVAAPAPTRRSAAGRTRKSS